MDRIPPQPTVLVTGESIEPQRSVARRLFEDRTADGDGIVAVTTREAPSALLGRLGGTGVELDRTAVVDARGSGDADAREAGDADDRAVRRLRRLPAGPAPEDLEAAVVASLDALEDAGVRRKHLLYDTLETGPSGAPPGETYDRAHALAMTLGTEEGLALFTLDAADLPEPIVDEVVHLFDVHVQLREVGPGTELRWTGLLGTSDGWLPLEEADLGVVGPR